MSEGQAATMKSSANSHSSQLKSGLARVVRTLEAKPDTLRGPFKINVTLSNSGKK